MEKNVFQLNLCWHHSGSILLPRIERYHCTKHYLNVQSPYSQYVPLVKIKLQTVGPGIAPASNNSHQHASFFCVKSSFLFRWWTCVSVLIIRPITMRLWSSFPVSSVLRYQRWITLKPLLKNTPTRN